MKPLVAWCGCVLVVAAAPVVFAQAPPVPGIGVAYFDNAPPGESAPDGTASEHWEWRPLAASRPEAVKIASAPTLVADANYWFSVKRWTSRVTAGAPWSPGTLYVRGQGPSAVWRRYARTLYYQLNNAPPPAPVVIPGAYGPQQYYASRYAWSGTIPANELPENWYLDPWRRYVVESATYGLDLPGSWGTYSDIATLFEGQGLAPGTNLGAGGVGLFYIFLACEYWMTIEYDNLLERLDQQARLYQSYRSPTQHDYYSLDDRGLGQKVIVRREVPNYTVPSGVDSFIAPSKNCLGSFVARSPVATAPTSGFAAQSKSVTITRQFTTATIPFQFALNCTSDAGANAAAQVGGRLSIVVHFKNLEGALRSLTFDVAGFASDQRIAPWAFVRQKDALSWSDSNSAGNAVAMSYATNGTNTLSLPWSGEVVLRAIEFGVDRFEKVELVARAEAGNAGTGETATVQAVLAAQPCFARNIAEGGAWRTAAINQTVTFTADASLLPENTQSVTYQWDFRDGGTATGQSVTHAFTVGGTYDVLLKVDPTVPSQAPNAALFNDSQAGWSYDIVRVVVPIPTGATGPGSSPTVIFSDVVLVPGNGQATVKWKTSCPMTSRVSWGKGSPTGPYLPGDSGEVENATSYTTNHTLTITGLKNGATYYLLVSGKPLGGTEYVWERVNGSSQPHPVLVGMVSPGGSRSEPPRPDVVSAWATAVSDTQTRFCATLAQQGEARLRYRALPDMNWITTSWNAPALEHQWLVQTGPGSAYEFFIETRADAQDTVRVSRSFYYATSPPPPATPGSVQFATLKASDGDQIVFARPFVTAPVIVTSAQYGGKAIASCAVNNSPTGFRISLRDLGDGAVSGAWLQYLAFVPVEGSPLRGAVLQASDNQPIGLPVPPGTPPGVPVIVCSAQKNGKAVMAAAVDNSGLGFFVRIRDLRGAPVSGAWLQYVAALPPTEVVLSDGGKAKLLGAVERRADGQRLGFAPALASMPTVVSSSQLGGMPQMACSVNNSTTGTTISMIESSGARARDGWLQWLAIARN